MKTLRCSSCKHDLPEEYFGIDRHRARGRNAYCLECDALYQMCSRYGITVEQYWEMYQAQGGVCAICLCPERMVLKRTGKLRRLCVDHDHMTNEVRALLCGPCNIAIGQLITSENCLRAAEYLVFHTPKIESEKTAT